MLKRVRVIVLLALAAVLAAFAASVVTGGPTSVESSETPCVRPTVLELDPLIAYIDCGNGVTPSPSPTATETVTETPTPRETPTPSESPTPTEPPAADPPLIGMSAPANLWAQRKSQVEATGGELEARRVFLTSLTSSLGLVEDALGEGLLPVVSFKPGDWGNVAAGQSDAALRSLATRLAALDERVDVAFHHEPDQQSTPPDQGEGGTAAEFAAMQSRIVDVMAPLAPKVRFSVIVNGWWFTDRNAHLTDAQLNVWLPRSLRDKLDIIAADDYSPESGEAAVVKTQNRVEWAQRVGGVKATGVAETNAFTASQLTSVFAYAKTEPLFEGGWILVWNAEGTTYRPLTETGLLDDFQAILVGWHD